MYILNLISIFLEQPIDVLIASPCSVVDLARLIINARALEAEVLEEVV